MLQAAGGVRIQVREPDDMGEPGEPDGRPGLLVMEQREESTLLRVQRLQGGAARKPPAGVAEGQRRSRRGGGGFGFRVSGGVRRLQECANPEYLYSV